ncbi:putative membrane protein [Candidatus Kuenenia stuttgartiensis]|jgi:hypothetical protein|uniref:Putative membrane protein n=1 Tax=Kuenenia stuttgartiensis TaxID=174633 RepID=Q1Q682_KUEST|nr:MULTISPECIES: hypothetical protein [Kuenenia]MBE7548325.1 hypothetical protein [Planctomycetia bacterium]MBW7943584.1 hypothetical protein [Candidatus Kuenenia stuttgartiensis]MBZ0192747.1 hypothetical protein [Candidatus Kuenenia stuttgartiensis]MCF6153230.1 hypothetical protein [Candidatus Kuenenia stuttgartiensis]MCL4726802.1 hypothetical protein [Candidatus Kuenenia stuttgartiensis]
MAIIENYIGQNKLTQSAIKDLKVGARLVFIGVNLSFLVGNLIHGLIYFEFLRAGNHGREYEAHVPNLPDMFGDIVMAIVFAFAYLFIASDSVKRVADGISDVSSGLTCQDKQAVEQLIKWVKGLFYVSIIGFGLYFLSKYFLSEVLEVFLEEEEDVSVSMHHISFAAHKHHVIPIILNILNDFVKLGSVFIFVTVYCRYLSLGKYAFLTLYAFFFIRFLFATNMFGFIDRYDLYMGAAILDFLTPVINIISIISIAIGV